MWSNVRLCELFEIAHPVVQAPMATVTTPELAAGVAKAGGLGGLGCATLSVGEIRQQVESFRAQTSGGAPIHLNFFVHKPPVRDEVKEQRARALVKPFYDRFQIDVPDIKEPFQPFGEKEMEAILALKVEIVSFHFGLPDQALVERLKTEGVKLIGCATSVSEAMSLASRGVDAICAQGWEAGGHRGTFEASYAAGSIGTMALVPQIVDAVGLPVIAAGGITDGRGMAAAMMLGADGVQMGTAFLRCPEAILTDPQRRAIRDAEAENTRLTRAFSGGLARGLRNAYLDGLAPHDDELPPFPLMNTLSKPLRTASAKADVQDCLPLWAGQAAKLARAEKAEELVASLIDDCRRVLGTRGVA